MNRPSQDVRDQCPVKNVTHSWNELHQVNGHFENKPDAEIGHAGQRLNILPTISTFDGV